MKENHKVLKWDSDLRKCRRTLEKQTNKKKPLMYYILPLKNITESKQPVTGKAT